MLFYMNFAMQSNLITAQNFINLLKKQYPIGKSDRIIFCNNYYILNKNQKTC